MTRAQERAVQELWERKPADLPVKTPEEFVTLASIVEKETGKADERPRVASVFINRLRSGMRLQSDPTIIYGIFGGAGKPPDRPILKSDIEKPTPYNTYRIDGLPPTPIANPGRAALEAVANPSRTDELYFVADGTGGHAFARTLEDHNRNVARWRKVREARREAAESAEPPACSCPLPPQRRPRPSCGSEKTPMALHGLAGTELTGGFELFGQRRLFNLPTVASELPGTEFSGLDAALQHDRVCAHLVRGGRRRVHLGAEIRQCPRPGDAVPAASRHGQSGA
jgi:hypothetical protein